MITVHGIPNCDTCKKARKWLTERGVQHTFHDFRKDGLEAATVTAWLGEVGADKLINRRGTTWRGLSDSDKAAAEGAGAADLLAENPTLIKRPVIDLGDRRLVGFDASVLEAAVFA